MRRLGGDYSYDPEYSADLNDEWHCEACGAGNSRLDGDCQFCDCGGFGKCRRSNCDAVEHFYPGGSPQLKAQRLIVTRDSFNRFFPGGIAQLAQIQRENRAKLVSASPRV